jgi:hypothetical protein
VSRVFVPVTVRPLRCPAHCLHLRSARDWLLPLSRRQLMNRAPAAPQDRRPLSSGHSRWPPLPDGSPQGRERPKPAASCSGVFNLGKAIGRVRIADTWPRKLRASICRVRVRCRSAP